MDVYCQNMNMMIVGRFQHKCILCHRSNNQHHCGSCSTVMDAKLNFLELFGIFVECYTINWPESEQNKRFQAKFQRPSCVPTIRIKSWSRCYIGNHNLKSCDKNQPFEIDFAVLMSLIIKRKVQLISDQHTPDRKVKETAVGSQSWKRKKEGIKKRCYTT